MTAEEYKTLWIDTCSAPLNEDVTSTPRDPVNVFLAGLPSTWGESKLKDFLQPFGDVVSVRIVPERHYAFAQFASAAGAKAAIDELHGKKVCTSSSTPLHVTYAVHSESSTDTPNNRLFVRGLPTNATKEDLVRIGAPYGTVLEARVVVQPGTDRCKGSGFITFDSVTSAAACLANTSGSRVPFGDGEVQHEILIRYCETEEQRQARLKHNKERIAKLPSRASSSSVTPTSRFVSLSGQTGSPHPASPDVAFGVFRHEAPVSQRAVAQPPPPTLILRGPSPNFPRPGDLFLWSTLALTPHMVRDLLTEACDPPLMVCPFNGGFAARLPRVEMHSDAALCLNDTAFTSGETLVVQII